MSTDMSDTAVHANKRWVQTLSLTPPSLSDNTADLDRLLSALRRKLKIDRIQVDFDLMRKIPSGQSLRAFAIGSALCTPWARAS